MRISIVIILCTLSAALLQAGCSAYFTEKTETRGKIARCYSPVLKADAAGIYAACNYFGSVYFLKSSDGGATWTRTTVASGGSLSFSSLEAEGGNFYIVYYDATASNILFTKSAGGSGWSAPVTVDTLSSSSSSNSIAANGTAIIISYHDSTNSDLKIARSIDGGNTWSASTVDGANFTGRYTWAAAEGSANFHVSYWYGTGNSSFTNNPVLMTARSTSNGAAWSTAVVTHPSSLCYGLYTVMSVQGSEILVAYYDTKTYTFNTGTNTFTVPSTGSLGFVRSSDSGAAWSTPVDIDSYRTGGLDRFGLVRDGTSIHAVYWDMDRVSLKISTSSDNGTSWASRVIDSNMSGDVPILAEAQAAAVNGAIYVLYEGEDYYLYFTSSNDGGTTWTWH